MPLTLDPIGDHLIVKPIREKETKSGIVLPETNNAKSDRGEVLAVGPGRLTDDGTRLPMDVNVGDTVLFAKYAADEVDLDGETYLVLTQPDIKARIKN